MGFSSKPSIKRTTPADVFGHILGVPVGSTFENRLFLHHSSVHSGIMAGIYGTKDMGCFSIVLSGGYEDDKDEGYRFNYTGCGGRDTKNGEKPREGPQTCDQKWENSRNASLRVSAHTKKPVRVVRGYKLHSDYAPCEGYRYDGLYVVDQAFMDTGKSGFKVCKFVLRRLPDQPPIPRRQGTLHLDLSRWEEPRHFGEEPRSPTSPKSAKQERVEKGKERAHGNAVAGPSQVRKPPPMPAPAPILPTTNMTSVRTRPGFNRAQAPTSAPSVNVGDILAEMRGSKPSQTSMSTSAGPSRPPAPLPSNRTTDPRKRFMPSVAARSGAPSGPVQNTPPLRRKRSVSPDADGLEYLKRAKADLSSPRLASKKSMPQACPGPRQAQTSSPVKRERAPDVFPIDSAFIDLTLLEDDD